MQEPKLNSSSVEARAKHTKVIVAVVHMGKLWICTDKKSTSKICLFQGEGKTA